MYVCECVEGLSKWTLVVECVLRAYRMETKWTDGLKAEPQTPTLITAVIQNFCVFNNLYLGNELEESFRSWHHHRWTILQLLAYPKLECYGLSGCLSVWLSLLLNNVKCFICVLIPSLATKNILTWHARWKKGPVMLVSLVTRLEEPSNELGSSQPKELERE